MMRLEIADLTVRYPGLTAPALDIGSLVLDAGDRVALTGPSGSGKTTFINIVTGMERAGSGVVSWNDEDLAKMPEGSRDRWRSRNVGLVMQDFHLFPGLSAEDNVLLPQRLSRLRLPSDMRGRAIALLERVGIARPDQPVETMSRGQMQRVAVARAILARPGLIVADEPTASLDRDSGDVVSDLLIELAGETGSVLITATHDQSLIGKLDRALRLENGRLSD